MRTDADILDDIKEELKWEDRINGAEINVKVANGHVKLFGTIDSFPKKRDAEVAAVRIKGVTGLTNALEVKIPLSAKKADRDIQQAIYNAIKWNSTIDENDILINVSNGWVLLEGSVNWEYQKSKARYLSEDIKSVIGVTDLITVVPAINKTKEIKEKVIAALKRSFYLDTNKIHVAVEEGKIILSGEVRTLDEKRAIEIVACAASGISVVENMLRVSNTGLSEAA